MTEEQKPEPTEAEVERAEQHAAEIEERYRPGARETVVLEGSDGMVSGTAFDDKFDQRDRSQDRDSQGQDSQRQDSQGQEQDSESHSAD